MANRKNTAAPKSDAEKAAAKAARAALKTTNFVKIAKQRMNGVLPKIKNVGNLANTNSYSFDKAQADKIVKTLKDAVEAVEARFTAALNGTSAKADDGFDF